MTAPQPSYTHRGTVLKIHDADSLTVQLDLGIYGGSKSLVEVLLRLGGVNSPELSTPEGRQALFAVSTPEWLLANGHAQPYKETR